MVANKPVKKTAAKPAKRKSAETKPQPEVPTPHAHPTIMPYHQWTHDATKVRILKCVGPDRKAHGGFVWPESGEVKPDKWVADNNCGNGLHGWAWGEHEMPDSWEVVEWKAPGGFGSQGADDSQGKENCKKERLWFSPHCLTGKKKAQREMFTE